ncbi:unnamed protein product [Parascedosporium putredinis]|uniref:Uncharacterized protein n=1 Tax=Parascedosporium putredinis TaxID=1442378 RepID=A0A9P1GWM9_9PEZI|nr:unnamed protein product [Parascedosporium putredinis]CAI7988946.1 unnamed protein product [Parascedosporium putredinis]
MARVKLVALLSNIVTSTRELYQELKFASAHHAALSTQVDSTKKTIEFAANALSDIIERCPDGALSHVVDPAQLRRLLRDCAARIENAKEILWRCRVAGMRGRLRFALRRADVQAILRDLSPVALWLCVNLSAVVVGLARRLAGAAEAGASLGEEKLLLARAFGGRACVEAQMKEALEAVAALMGPDPAAGLAREAQKKKEGKSRGVERRMSLSERKPDAREPAATTAREEVGEGSEKHERHTPSTGWSIQRIPTGNMMKKGLLLAPQATAAMAAERSPSRYVPLPTPAPTDSTVSRRTKRGLNPSLHRPPPPAVPTPPSNNGGRALELMSGALAALDSRSSFSLHHRSQLYKIGFGSNRARSPHTPWRRSRSSSGAGSSGSSSSGVRYHWPRPATTTQTAPEERPDDFLDAFARIMEQKQQQASSTTNNAANPVSKLNWAPGTWLGIAGWVDAAWAFLFFQRQDGWVQLSLVPDDSARSAVLLEPIIQVPVNSPMHCEVTRGYHGRTVIRLFIFIKDEDESYALLGHGAVRDPPAAPGGPQVEDLIAWDTGMSVLLAASASGGVVSVYERTSLTGNWESIPYPEKIPVEAGDYIFHTELPGSHKVRLRRLNGAGITHGSGARLNVLGKEVDWHRHPPKASPGSCRVVHNANGTVAGIFCQTAEDDIYLFRGHPWWNDLHSPEFVCSVLPGSKFVVSESRRMLIFVSRENEMQRVDFGLDREGEVTIETVGPLFSGNCVATTLPDLLLKSPIDDYLQYRPLYQGSSADYYDTESSSSSSSSSSGHHNGLEHGASTVTSSSFRSSPFDDASRSWLGLPETDTAPLLGSQAT